MTPYRCPFRRKLTILITAAFFLCTSAPKAQTFLRITGDSTVTQTGAWRSVNWVDYDHDGYLDLYVTRGKAGGQNNVLFHNDGFPDFSFTRMSGSVLSQDGEPSDGSSWADYDNDGNIDAFTANWYNRNNLLYHSTGNGSFTRVVQGPVATDGGYSETGSWGDYNNDGLVDLYVANSAGTLQDFLYKNLGGGQFLRIPVGRQSTDAFPSRGVTWVDYDGDGDMDLFVANEGNQDESLYRNMLMETGVDSFAAVTGDVLVTSAGASWSASWADFDNDGDQDVFVVNQSNQRSRLFVNNGNGSFSLETTGPIATDSGYGASAAWGDMDNDGDLDLVVSHAYAGTPVTNFLYRNLLMETGVPTFERVMSGPIVSDSGYSYGLSWGDFDNDGDLDLFVARTWNEDQTNAFYRNLGNSNHWLTVEGRGIRSNAAAIGAEMRALATIGGRPVRQLRVIEGQSGYCGQNLQVHFGLGDAQVIDSLIVQWPSGSRNVFTHVAADRIVRILEDTVTAPDPLLPAEGLVTEADTVRFTWRHDLCGRPFHLQVSTDPSFPPGMIYDNPDLGDTTLTLTNLSPNALYHWRVRSSRTIDPDRWSGVRTFSIGPFTYSFIARQAWNLISMPLASADSVVSHLFPGARSAAYGYDGSGYVAEPVLAGGRGYWMRFLPGDSIRMTGALRLTDTIAVDSGWNLIGSLSFPVSTAALVSEPPNTIVSNFFGYEGSYVHADSLLPWRGYWVKARQAGILKVQSNGGAANTSGPGR